MTNISDASIAQIIANAGSIKSLCDQSISLLNVGTAWSRAAVNAPLFSNSDLTVEASSPSGHLVPTTLFAASARYGEVVVNVAGNPGYLGVGIIAASQPIGSPPLSLTAVPAKLWVWRSDGYVANNGASSLTAPTFANGDNIGLYITTDGKVFGSKNGVWIGDPVAETGALFTGLAGVGACTIAAVFFGNAGSAQVTGQFSTPTYPPPAGAGLYE